MALDINKIYTFSVKTKFDWTREAFLANSQGRQVSSVVMSFNPGDTVTIKRLHGDWYVVVQGMIHQDRYFSDAGCEELVKALESDLPAPFPTITPPASTSVFIPATKEVEKIKKECTNCRFGRDSNLKVCTKCYGRGAVWIDPTTSVIQ